MNCKVMVLEIVIFSILAVILFVFMIPKRARNEIINSFKTRQARLILGCGSILIVLLVGIVWILVQYSNM